MDPDVCWKLLVLALVRGDASDAREHAGDLAEWIAKEGYTPRLLLDAQATGDARRWAL